MKTHPVKLALITLACSAALVDVAVAAASAAEAE